ncbi:hypothetical protein GCK72_012906 [Caenorhabditis remanei]|uniref:Uncharacterized protein n=1 Tax=Caenorhabditis remanei TaxID=31234 RepID=A0A6A5GPE8_CAERE|nr:hypothetical protein GCK72_012906 [Caenorhabditis remanei]KAF1756453.1 hypothetical protein GCK72_012906 [Caenorhabditis remanei]
MNTTYENSAIETNLELAEKTDNVSADSENDSVQTDNFLIGIDWNDEEDDVFQQDTVDKKSCGPEVGSYSKGLSMCTCDLDHGQRLDTNWSGLGSCALGNPNISVSKFGNLGSYDTSSAESRCTVVGDEGLKENVTPFSFKSSLEKRAKTVVRNTVVRQAMEIQRRRLHAKISRKREAVHSVTQQLEAMIKFEAKDPAQDGNNQHGGQPMYSPLFLYSVHFQEANV